MHIQEQYNTIQYKFI